MTSYSPDVNEITNDDVTAAGKYLVFNIFVGLGDVVVIIILVSVVSIILVAFGMKRLFGKQG